MMPSACMVGTGTEMHDSIMTKADAMVVRSRTARRGEGERRTN